MFCDFPSGFKSGLMRCVHGGFSLMILIAVSKYQGSRGFLEAGPVLKNLQTAPQAETPGSCFFAWCFPLNLLFTNSNSNPS